MLSATRTVSCNGLVGRVQHDGHRAQSVHRAVCCTFKWLAQCACVQSSFNALGSRLTVPQ